MRVGDTNTNCKPKLQTRLTSIFYLDFSVACVGAVGTGPLLGLSGSVGRSTVSARASPTVISNSKDSPKVMSSGARTRKDTNHQVSKVQFYITSIGDHEQ